MPIYRYKAFDNAGTEHEGTITAASSGEALQHLKAQGLKIRNLKEEAPPSQPVKPPTPKPAPAKPTNQAPQPKGQPLKRPVQPSIKPSPQPPKPAPTQSTPPTQQSPARPRHAAPSQIDLSGVNSAPLPQTWQSTPVSSAAGPAPIINVPVTPVKPNILTAPGTDKERMFLFAQIAASLRAGINPSSAFQEIATKSPPKYRESLLEAATMATEGLPASKVFQRYPDLYPEHIPSTIKAGEMGGFLADSYDAVSQHAEQTHKFRKWFWFVWVVLINGALSIPLAFLFKSALIDGYKRVEQGGEYSMGSGLKAMGMAFWEAIKWPYGPVSLASYVVLWFLYKFLISRVTTDFRHFLAYKWPIVGQRARFEGLTQFSWVMGKLSQAGIPYATSWEVAAGSVPNRTMRKELLAANGALTGTEKASDLIARSSMFPPEYASVVATGEYAGNVPGSLEQLSRMSKQDFETQTNLSKARTGCWGALGCAVITAFVLGVVMVAWYYDLPKVVLSGMDQ